MKKKLFALLMVAGMTVFAAAGCGVSVEVEPSDQSAVQEENVAQDETAGQDEQTDYSYSVQARDLDGARLLITYGDETGAITGYEETDGFSWFGAPGQTIGEMMADWDMISIEPLQQDYEFLGWACCTSTMVEDENGFVEDVETELFDGKIFTTEEMMNQELPDGNIIFYTVWGDPIETTPVAPSLDVCGGCELEKECTIYNIDGVDYYVCDDCYEEFATGMGLLD